MPRDFHTALTRRSGLFSARRSGLSKARLASTLLAVLTFVHLSAWATEPLNVKLGLWEVTWTMQQAGTPTFSAEQLEKMSPELRKQLESTLSARAANGMSDVAKTCIAAEDRSRIFQREDNPNCKTTTLEQSATALHYTTECLDTRGARTSDFRVEAPNPETATGTMDATSKAAGGRETKIQMKIEAKWLQDACDDEPAS